MGLELRIGAGGPSGRQKERRGNPPGAPASERLRQLLETDTARHPGSNQPQNGRRLGIPTPWIQAVLRGNVPRLKRAQRLAEALGSTLSLGEEAVRTPDDEAASAVQKGRATKRQQELLMRAAKTLKTRPEALDEGTTADGIPSMEESGYLADHIVRNEPESRRLFNHEMAAIRKRPNGPWNAADPDVVNGTVIEAAVTALGITVMPVIFDRTWPGRWRGAAGIGKAHPGRWRADAQETRAVLAAVANGRIGDAFIPWWEDAANENQETS